MKQGSMSGAADRRGLICGQLSLCARLSFSVLPFKWYVATGAPEPDFRFRVCENCSSSLRASLVGLFQKNAAIPVTPSNRYIVACSIVTFILTAIIVAGHFSPVASTIFVGTKVEGVVTIVLVAFWTAIVAVNTQAADGLAPVGESSNAVENGNLYYFSWGGFILSVVLFVSFLRDAFGVDMVGHARQHGVRLQWWAALLAASVVVLGSASQVLSQDCHGEEAVGSAKYCRKTKWAISGGFFNMLLCGLVITAKVFKYTTIEAATPFLLEMAVSIFLTVINVFVVGYVTSADSPGSAIGNLYYFSWAMFLLAAVLVSECYTEYTQPPTSSNGASEQSYPSSSPPTYNTNNRGELAVESLDDNL
jgi:hypothetical protein